MSQSDGFIPYHKAIFSGPVDINSSIPFHDLHDKTILITGGASGFGAACFQEWARHGANVVIGDINDRAGEQLVAKVRKETSNANHHFISLDVLDWSSQVAFFKQAASLSPHRGIDCVVANAGICDGLETHIFENPPDYSSIKDPAVPKLKTLNINLTGVMYTTTLALSYLSRNPGSTKCTSNGPSEPRDRHLVLISSVAGVAPFPSQSIYAASKHGVVGLFRALRITAPIAHGIRVNMLNPYFVNTPIMGSAGALMLSGGALGQIDDVVEAATRLVADQHIIGRALMIATKGYAEQMKAVGLQVPQGLSDAPGIWDIYGHDFEQTDLFTRRIVALINIVSSARGWLGIAQDILMSIVGPLKRTIKW